MLIRSHTINSLLKLHVVCLLFCFLFCFLHCAWLFRCGSLVIRLIVFCCHLLAFTAQMSIGLPMIAGLVPFGLPFTNSITFLLTLCLPEKFLPLLCSLP